jgi:hypothetical protein
MSQGNGAGGGSGGLWSAGMPGLGGGPVSSRFQPYILQPGSPSAYTCFGMWEDKAPSCIPIEAVTSDDPLDGCSQAGECRAWALEQNPPTTRFPVKPRRDGRFEIQQFRDFIREQETYNMVTETGRIIVTYPGNRPVPKAKRFFLNVKNLEEAELDVDLEFELIVTVERMILRQASKGAAVVTARPVAKPEEDEAKRKDRISDLLKGKIRKDIRSEDPAAGGAGNDDIDDFDFEGLELDEFEDDLDEEDIEVDLAEEDVADVADEAVEAELVPVDLGDEIGFDDDGELELELEGDDGDGDSEEEEPPAAIAEPSEEGGKAKGGGKKAASGKGGKASREEDDEAPRGKSGKKAEAAAPPAKAGKKAAEPEPAPAKGKKAAEPEPAPAKGKKAAEPEPAPAKGGKKAAEPEPVPAKGGKKAEVAPPAAGKAKRAPEPEPAPKGGKKGPAQPPAGKGKR